MSEKTLLEKAIEYTNRGWYVFPCREIPGKTYINEKGKKVTPKVKSPYTHAGFKDATLDINTIKQWWTRWPNAGIGISCGHSNLVVVDIDIRDGKNGFDNFMKMNISDEGALHAITPSGGVHIIYSGKIDSHANVKIGVDIRSEGAYIVAPPSWILEDNGEKTFYREADDWNRTPVKMPASLESELNKLRGMQDKSERKRTTVSNEPIQKTIDRLEKALNDLDQWRCEDYFEWVAIGLALKTIGIDGFTLWNNWSKKSSKYDYEALEDRWDKFKPKDISIASIFYKAKMDRTGIKNA